MIRVFVLALALVLTTLVGFGLLARKRDWAGYEEDMVKALFIAREALMAIDRQSTDLYATGTASKALDDIRNTFIKEK